MRNSYAAANYLSCFLSASTKPRTEIAKACGIEKPNKLALMAHGHIPIPFDLIVPLSRELSFPPQELFSLALEIYQPALYQCVRELDQSGAVIPKDIDEMEVFFRSIPALKDRTPEIMASIYKKISEEEQGSGAGSDN